MIYSFLWYTLKVKIEMEDADENILGFISEKNEK